jgi:hypothetical protein
MARQLRFASRKSGRVGEALLFGIGPKRDEGRSKAWDFKKPGDVRSPEDDLSQGDLLGGEFREGRERALVRADSRN